MIKIDFFDRLKEYLESFPETFRKPIEMTELEPGNNIALVATPTSPEDRYNDGSKIVPFGFQILVKHSDHHFAYSTVSAFAIKLDGMNEGQITSSDGSFIFNKCEVYTMPTYVEKTNDQEWIYTAMFQAELLI